MAANKFKSKQAEDMTIVDSDNKIVGHIRVKPNAVMWKKKGAHLWNSLSLENFARLAEKHGEEKKQ